MFELGLDVSYFSTIDAESFVEDQSYFFDHYGDEAEEFAEVADIEVINKSIKKAVENGLFERKKIEIIDIEKAINNTSIPLLLIDWNELTNSGFEYQGHLVVLTGYDSEHFYYHEPGPKNPEPHRKVPKSKMMRAWDKQQTDHDVVIVYGTKSAI